jgi:hypothetical protein
MLEGGRNQEDAGQPLMITFIPRANFSPPDSDRGAGKANSWPQLQSALQQPSAVDFNFTSNPFKYFRAGTSFDLLL